MEGKFKVKNLFRKSLSQNFEVLTLGGDVINPKIDQNDPNIVSCINVDRKMKIKKKGYFEVKYSFIAPFSQNSEVLT